MSVKTWRWSLGVTVGVLGWMSAQPASGCSTVCVSVAPRPIEAAKRGALVFVGESGPVENPERRRVAVISVVRAYGATLPTQVRIASGMGADCVPYIEPSRRFLFVLDEQDPSEVLHVDSCTSSMTPVEAAHREIKALEKWWRKRHK
jgi:hypothetical protein